MPQLLGSVDESEFFDTPKKQKEAGISSGPKKIGEISIPVNEWTGEGGSTAGLPPEEAMGPSLIADTGLAIADTLKQSKEKIGKRYEQLAGPDPSLLSKAGASLATGVETLIGAAASIPGLALALGAFAEKTKNRSDIFAIEVFGNEKLSPEEKQKILNNTPISKELSQFFRSLIGFNEENQGAFEGALEAVASPFSGGIQALEKNYGPDAALAAEGAMLFGGLGLAGPRPARPAVEPKKAISEPVSKTGLDAEQRMLDQGRAPEPKPTPTKVGEVDLIETGMSPEEALKYDQYRMRQEQEFGLDLREANQEVVQRIRQILENRPLRSESEIRPEILRKAEEESMYRQKEAVDEQFKDITSEAIWKDQEVRNRLENPPFERSVLIDYGFEERRPTALSEAFLRAQRKKQGGSIDPELLTLGVSNVFDSLGRDWRKLLNKFKGTFTEEAIQNTIRHIDKSDGDAQLILISPDDFHNLAASREYSESGKTVPYLKPEAQEAARVSIREGLAGEGLKELPELGIDESGAVYWHEGRHRMDVFKEAGLDKIPVVLWDKSRGTAKEWVSEIQKDGSTQIRPVEKSIIGLTEDPLGTLRQKEIDIEFHKAATEEAIRMAKKAPPLPESKRKALQDIMEANRLKYGKQSGGWTLPNDIVNAASSFRDWLKKELEPKGKDPELTKKYMNAINQSTAEFMSTLVKPDKPDDLGYRLGFSTATYRTLTEWASHIENYTYEIARHFDQKLKETIVAEHLMNNASKKTFDEFHKYYGLNKIFRKEFREKYQQDLAIVLEMERNPSHFFNKDNPVWYPSADHLVSMGMSPESARIWRSVFDEFEKSWDRLDEAMAAAGRPPLPRVPGYIPHIFKGPYSVVIWKPKLDGEGIPILDSRGRPEKTWLGEFNYSNLKETEKALDYIKGRFGTHEVFQGATFEIEKPSPHGNQVHTLLEGLQRARDISGASEGLGSLIRMIHDSTARGIITPALERGHPTKIGHLFQRATLEPNSVTGLSPKEIVKSVTDLRESVKAVNSWAAKQRFLNETFFPLYAGGFLESSSLQKRLNRYMESYFKIPDVIGKEVDIKIRDMLINSGQDPRLAHKFSEMFTSAFSKYFLWANPSFYIVNGTQFTVSLPVLMGKKSFGVLHGEKTGSIVKALTETATQLKEITLLDLIKDKNKSELLKWFEDRGVIDPIYIEVFDPSKAQDIVAMQIEKRTRLAAALSGYNYFKQFMNDVEARNAAAEFANEVAVPYSLQRGAPLALSQMPVIGRTLAMFLTYQQHMLGMMNSQLQLINQTRKAKNPKAFSYALGSALSLQGINMALYGLSGAALSTMYDQAAYWLNRILEGDFRFPMTKEIARQIDETLFKDKNYATFGTVSNLIGYDVSASATGVSPQVPTAGVRGFETLFQGMFLSGRWALTGGKVTRQEWWDWAREMPPVAQGGLEWMIRGNLFRPDKADLFATMAMKDPDLPGLPRTVADQVVRAVFGLRSVEEKAFGLSEQLYKQKEANLDAKIRRLGRQIKEDGLTESNLEELNEIVLENPQNPTPWITSMVKFKMMQGMTPDERMAFLGKSSIKGAGKYQRYLQERQYEPGN